MDQPPPSPAPFEPPETFNSAGYFLDDRVREGAGARPALHTDTGTLTYREVQALANRFGNLLGAEGVHPEQRVIVALPDGPAFVAAVFGALKMGAVVVMVNPHLRPAALREVLAYSRAAAAFVDGAGAGVFTEACAGLPRPPLLFDVDDDRFAACIGMASAELEAFPTHRDDPAIWLFSGGTSGRPKAVVQPHRSFANTTELYGKRILRLTGDDVTLSVPRLFFGYALGSGILFPFAVGAAAVLFPERPTPEAVFARIARHRPTVLVNVPTMVQQMVAHPDARAQDLSSLRLATSAGEALPVELHRRWDETFGVELLDGLGTAEMWHIFLSNRPGEVRPGTLGRPVPGFDVRIRDDDGRDLPAGAVGALWVRGGSRALGYWQNLEATARAFRGEWYVSEDMLSRDDAGYFTYAGRGDDLLKVAGRWLAPGEVENCLVQHPGVREAAVVGVVEADGLTRPWAYVVGAGAGLGAGEGVGVGALEEELARWVRERLESYKVPRRFVFLEALPRTHLGKVDRGKLRAG
jgi:benzoate-CoA ligase family protein